VKLFDWLQHRQHGMAQDGMGQGQTEAVRCGARPRRFYDDARHRSLGKVAKVMVETWDTGPFATDICWLLADAEDHILFVLPTGALDGKALLARIGKRPGFDKVALRRAMKSTRNERFTVWQRDLIADKSKTR
jgi:hypothetical protein